MEKSFFRLFSTIKKLYNLYSGFAHYINYRAFFYLAKGETRYSADSFNLQNFKTLFIKINAMKIMN